MTKTIRWGIVGCGGIAAKFAAGAAVVGDVQVVAAASRTPGKAEAFATKHGIGRHYTDYAGLLACDDIDAVYVATTHNFHYECVREVLKAGKPVMCEKPFTVNAREMQSLITLAGDRKLFMMEAMWTRFLPLMDQVRRWLAEGVIGDIKNLRATFGFQFPFDPNHRLLNPDLAGGALLDAGIYPLSFANMVMREKPVEVRALADIGSTGIDEQSACILRYHSGALALVDCEVSAPVVSRAEVVGTKGRIWIADKFLMADTVSLELNDQDPIQKHFPFDNQTGFQFEIDAASDSIRSGLSENPIMPLSDTLQLMETIDEIKAQVGLTYANDREK